jgi:hypothetical protein
MSDLMNSIALYVFYVVLYNKHQRSPLHCVRVGLPWNFCLCHRLLRPRSQSIVCYGSRANWAPEYRTCAYQKSLKRVVFVLTCRLLFHLQVFSCWSVGYGKCWFGRVLIRLGSSSLQHHSGWYFMLAALNSNKTWPYSSR